MSADTGAERRLTGGRSGAVRVGDTVRRPAGAWTPAVHSLLDHLERMGFGRAPRALGLDAEGREVLTFLPGETATSWPWPAWARSDEALRDAAGWLREYHEAVRGFRPPADARWRTGERWRPGLIIAHNDAGPHNAAWRRGAISGFFDWELAGPAAPLDELAHLAFAWVPLYAVEPEGTPADAPDPSERGHRLRMLLERYGAECDPEELLPVVQRRVRWTAALVERLGRAGDPGFARRLAEGTHLLLRSAADEVPGLVR